MMILNNCQMSHGTHIDTLRQSENPPFIVDFAKQTPLTGYFNCHVTAGFFLSMAATTI
jgi:hypothetical protein